MPTLGIDIGGSSVKVVGMDGDRVVWTGQSGGYARASTEQLVAAMREAVGGRDVAAEAVGVCVPGLMDEGRTMVTLSVNVPGLVGIRLRELVRRGLGVDVERVAVASDAVATGVDIAAARRLSGRLLVLALGTGIGAAVLDEGRPLLVDEHTPGHIGQMDVSLDGQPPIGPDGGAGSLEAYIGGAALARMGGDVPSVVRGWRGDEAALRALARAIRICHAIYRPKHVCLAGGIGIHLGHVLGAIRRLVCDRLTNVARNDWTLATADDDLHAARGAARLAAG